VTGGHGWSVADVTSGRVIAARKSFLSRAAAILREV